MAGQVEGNLPAKIYSILSALGKVIETSRVDGSGAFHAGQAWKLRLDAPQQYLLIKSRPKTELARNQSVLAFSLLDSSMFRDIPWAQKPVRQFGPSQEVEGSLYQAWHWMPGKSPDELQFPIVSALERLRRVHHISRILFGERKAAIPGVLARLGCLEKPIKGDFPRDPVVLKAKEIVEQWSSRGIDYLRSVSCLEALCVCHGDCWIGNWLVAGEVGDDPSRDSKDHPALVDWSNVRWDHPAVDRARLIGSVGDLIKPETNGDNADSLERLLAWTGHVAALRNWLIRFEKIPWQPAERDRVQWLLSRLGETPG